MNTSPGLLARATLHTCTSPRLTCFCNHNCFTSKCFILPTPILVGILLEALLSAWVRICCSIPGSWRRSSLPSLSAQCHICLYLAPVQNLMLPMKDHSSRLVERHPAQSLSLWTSMRLLLRPVLLNAVWLTTSPRAASTTRGERTQPKSLGGQPTNSWATVRR